MKILVVDDRKSKGVFALDVARKFGEAEFASTPEEACKKIPDADLIILDFWYGFRKWPFLLKDCLSGKKIIIFSSMVSRADEKILDFFRKEFERAGIDADIMVSLPTAEGLEEALEKFL